MKKSQKVRFVKFGFLCAVAFLFASCDSVNYMELVGTASAKRLCSASNYCYLTWNAVSSASYYNIYVQQSSGKYVKAKNASSSSTKFYQNYVLISGSDLQKGVIITAVNYSGSESFGSYRISTCTSSQYTQPRYYNGTLSWDVFADASTYYISTYSGNYGFSSNEVPYSAISQTNSVSTSTLESGQRYYLWAKYDDEYYRISDAFYFR